ncbi:MAG TPA: hypothetical protein VK689_05750 [Armatimonadota bacterium]|nr:hypothetical protein [Armatimonadota bacterium]
MTRFLWVFVGMVLVGSGAIAPGAEPSDETTVLYRRRRITPPPAQLKLDPFYKKYLDAGGIPVVSSDKVADAALLTARDLARGMLSKRPKVRAALARSGVRIAVMAASEVTTDIPEHRDLNQAFPETDWDKRARGLGATAARPACSVGEENLLQHATDRYRGESIFIHEFAHTVLTMGVQAVDPKFRPRLEAAFRNAKADGRWARTYAATNPDEYWAEGVQSWYDANREALPPNGIHNEVDTREELVRYDPALAGLVAEVFPAGWRWSRR